MYLGIDLGTGTLKAALFDADGALVVAAEESYKTDFSTSGNADFDASTWFEVCERVLSRIASTHGTEIEAIGLAGQMHGVVLVDDGGTPIRDAVLWPDHRAESMLDVFFRFDEEHGGVLGNPIVPGMAGPILAWMSRNEPESLRSAASVLQPKDWLRAQLCGSVGITDPSDASATLLYDLSADAWSEALCDAIGLRPSLLPRIERSSRRVARLRADLAERLGLGEIPVVVGSGDAAAALLGAGVEQPGTALINIGTGAQVMTPVRAPALGAGLAAGIHQYRSASEADRWYAMAAIANGGLALGWVRDIVGYDWDHLYGLAGSVLEDGSGDPLFLPFLVGEREPARDGLIGAAWQGLTLAHDSDALVRSALRGVAFYVGQRARALLDTTGVRGAVLSGGATRHLPWVELIASVLGVEVTVSSDMHITVRGAARLAARGLGHDLPEPTPGVRVPPRANGEIAAQVRSFNEAVSRHFSTSG